jgi:hypothetical protein
MNVETLDRAVGLAARTGCVFVATADVDGLPHLASAASISHVAAGQVAVTEWFCPGTMANVRDNRRVALVVWDAAEDVGYQLLGRVTKVEELAVLDGYDPAVEPATPPPQVERRLVVGVEKVILFSHAPHSDVEE